MATVQDAIKLFKGLIKKTDDLGKLKVKGGILEGATYPDGTSVSEIGLLMEFGNHAQGIPPRPFLKNTSIRCRESWSNIVNHAVHKMYFQDKIDVEGIGDLVAGQMEDDIRQTIENGVPPSSSQATIKRKIEKYGEDRGPLRDTYELLKSIATEVDLE